MTALGRLLGLLLLLLLTGAPPGAQAGNESFPLTEIAPGVYVHHGQHASVEEPGRGDSANIGFVVGQRCVAVIDTGGSLATGRALRQAIASHTDKPLCYVINTHGHFDHVLGNAAFLDAGVTFVGNRELPAVLAASEGFFRERFAAEVAPPPAPLFAREGQWVSDTQTLDLGERVLVLTAVPTAHSRADLTVLDRQTATLWTGDLVFMERLPVLDGSLKGWLDWLAHARKQGAARIVPGHGPATASWPAGADAERAYLETLHDEARTAVDAGEFLEDALARMRAHPPANWRLTNPHARNFSQAFREAEWAQ